MRVIGGKAKGKRLRAGRGLQIRPTSDRVRETIFDILGELVVGASFLDLFAGSGDVGIEALSRGAERVVFVDTSAKAVRLIRENLAACGFSSEYEILRRSVSYALTALEARGECFDIVFLDPPYRSTLVEETLKLLSESRLLLPDGLVIAEHHHKTPLIERYGALARMRQRVIGETVLSFYASVGHQPN